MMGDRFVSLHVRFALNSFGRDLERPGKHQRNREPHNKNENDNLHRPLRRIECGKKNRCRLNREPRDHRVSDRHLVNVAPLQLGEKIVELHFGATTFCTSASKRGSPRKGSSNGSTLIQVRLEPSRAATALSMERRASSLLFRLRKRSAREY